MKKQASRKQSKSAGWPEWWDWVLRGALLAITLGLSITLFDYFADPDNLPVQQVKVEGVLPHLDPAYLQQVIDPYVKAGFVRFNVKALQHALCQHPWVSDVFIQRLWPDTVLVRLTEHKPLARWGSHQLLSTEGIVFSPFRGAFPKELPYFEAPEGTEKTVLATYNQMNQRLVALPLTIRQLTLTPRGAWTLVLGDHMVIQLGRQEVIHRLERFVKAYDKMIYSHHEDVQTVDLRYPNGIAVGWVKGHAPL